MGYTIFLFLMILNGIIFFPPSEYIYFEAYWLDRTFNPFYLFLPLANSLGHYILFLLVRYQEGINYKGYFSSFKKIVVFSRKYTSKYFQEYDSSYLAVLYGRSIPVVHTAISIAAGLSNISHKRFILYTIIGNYIFSGICYMIISHAVQNEEYTSSLLLVVIIFSIIYLLHIFLEKVIVLFRK